MSISRWEPVAEELAELRDELDQWSRDGWGWPTRRRLRMRRFEMAVDLRETADAYVVEATVAGVKPEDLTVQVTEDTLRISGEVKEHREETGTQGDWLLNERRYGHIERSITLPTPIQSEAAEGVIAHGVLTITLPKAEHTTGHTIPIRTRT